MYQDYWVDSCHDWGLNITNPTLQEQLVVHAQPSGLPTLLRVGLSLHSDGSTHDLTPLQACTFFNKLNLILDKIDYCTFCGAY